MKTQIEVYLFCVKVKGFITKLWTTIILDIITIYTVWHLVNVLKVVTSN